MGWRMLVLVAITASVCVPVSGCTPTRPLTIAPSEAAKSNTLDDFIATNIHRPAHVSTLRYSEDDADKLLGSSRNQLQSYCKGQGGNLVQLSPREKLPYFGVRAPATGYFGEFLCRKADTKLWAVEIKPVSEPKLIDKQPGFFTSSDVKYLYTVNVRVNPINADIRQLPNCETSQAKAVLEQADEFLEKKLKVVPRLVDKSGFNKRVAIENLVVASRTKSANCPASMDEVRFSVSLQAPQLQPGLSYRIEPKEYPNVAYSPHGVTLEPIVTIESYTFHTFHPPKGFRDSNLQVAIESISCCDVKYRIRNLSSRYVDVQAVSIHLDEVVGTVPVSLSVPPNTTTAEQKMDVPKAARNIPPVTLTLPEAKSRTVDIGVSVKYRIGDKTQTLHAQQTYPYLQVVRD